MHSVTLYVICSTTASWRACIQMLGKKAVIKPILKSNTASMTKDYRQ